MARWCGRKEPWPKMCKLACATGSDALGTLGTLGGTGALFRGGMTNVRRGNLLVLPRTGTYSHSPFRNRSATDAAVAHTFTKKTNHAWPVYPVVPCIWNEKKWNFIRADHMAGLRAECRGPT